jgi:membrane-bound lytic murein transglycosylase D
LDQSWWIDEKLDPEKSTRAAAQHLLKLYDMFKDWYLVMAAYNAGEFGIQRITEKTGIRDFWQLADRKLLYRQTVDYVPSILATMIIAKHPEKYGFDVEPLLPIQSKKVRIPSPVDLSVVAGTVGLTLDEIRDLNPELRHLVTPANQKFYDINLPLDKSEEAVKTLAVMPEEKRVRWQRYEIQEGDSLWAISRHFRVSIEMIMDANNMTSTKLRVGRYLLIPPYPVPRTTSQAEAAKTAPKGSGGAATGPQMASKAPSAAVSKGAIQLSVSSNSGGNGNGSGKKDPKALATPTTSPSAPATVLAKPASGRAAGPPPVQAFSPAAAEPKSADKKIIHTIQRGDTLYDIARRYKTTANQLRQWNGLSGNLLRPGDTLLIFVPR